MDRLALRQLPDPAKFIVWKKECSFLEVIWAEDCIGQKECLSGDEFLESVMNGGYKNQTYEDIMNIHRTVTRTRGGIKEGPQGSRGCDTGGAGERVNTEEGWSTHDRSDHRGGIVTFDTDMSIREIRPRTENPENTQVKGIPTERRAYSCWEKEANPMMEPGGLTGKLRWRLVKTSKGQEVRRLFIPGICNCCFKGKIDNPLYKREGRTLRRLPHKKNRMYGDKAAPGRGVRNKIIEKDSNTWVYKILIEISTGKGDTGSSRLKKHAANK